MDHCYARKNNISRGKAKLKKKRKIRNLRHLTLRLTGIDVEVILWIIKGYIPQFTNDHEYKAQKYPNEVSR